MRIHAIIHAPFEKTGVIEDWARSYDYELSFTHTYLNEKLPDAATMDFLIIMGGPQSPLQLDKYPYLRDEILLAKDAIEKNRAVLGICLGAQIISESFGAQTERSPHKEVGIFPIELTKEGESDPIFEMFPKQFDVMHWHNDMPGLPDNAVLLAYSEGCPRQAIKYNDRVYGLQFHLEMSNDLVKEMVEHCGNDLIPGPYIQSKERLLEDDHLEINKKMIIILDYLSTLITEREHNLS